MNKNNGKLNFSRFGTHYPSVLAVLSHEGGFSAVGMTESSFSLTAEAVRAMVARNGIQSARDLSKCLDVSIKRANTILKSDTSGFTACNVVAAVTGRWPSWTSGGGGLPYVR